VFILQWEYREDKGFDDMLEKHSGAVRFYTVVTTETHLRLAISKG